MKRGCKRPDCVQIAVLSTPGHGLVVAPTTWAAPRGCRHLPALQRFSAAPYVTVVIRALLSPVSLGLGLHAMQGQLLTCDFVRLLCHRCWTVLSVLVQDCDICSCFEVPALDSRVEALDGSRHSDEDLGDGRRGAGVGESWNAKLATYRSTRFMLLPLSCQAMHERTADGFCWSRALSQLGCWQSWWPCQ